MNGVELRVYLCLEEEFIAGLIEEVLRSCSVLKIHRVTGRHEMQGISGIFDCEGALITDRRHLRLYQDTILRWMTCNPLSRLVILAREAPTAGALPWDEERYMAVDLRRDHPTVLVEWLSQGLLVPERNAGRGPTFGTLSRKEKEVLQLLLAGLSNEQISDSLFVSVSTIRTHVRNLLRKVGCTNRKELLVKYLAPVRLPEI